jgi:hypothetical protein
MAAADLGDVCVELQERVEDSLFQVGVDSAFDVCLHSFNTVRKRLFATCRTEQ